MQPGRDPESHDDEAQGLTGRVVEPVTDTRRQIHEIVPLDRGALCTIQDVAAPLQDDVDLFLGRVTDLRSRAAGSTVDFPVPAMPRRMAASGSPSPKIGL